MNLQKTHPSLLTADLELNLDAVGRVEQDLGRTRHPAVAAEELVTHGQFEVQDRANLRRARGVELTAVYPPFSDGYVMHWFPITTLGRHK